MVPTLEDQDRLIVNKLAYRLPPRVGDIVMLYYPEDPTNRSSSASSPSRATRSGS